MPTLATPARGAPEPEHAHGEDAGERRAAAQRKVRGREAERAAELAAVRDAPGHRVGTAEQPRRAVEVARGERLAHRGRARALAFDVDRRHRLDRERPRAAAQQREVAGARAAEAEVRADQQPAHAEPLDQHVLDEGLRLERRERAVEARDDHARDAEHAHHVELAAQAREPRGRVRRREELARMRIEGEHGRLEVEIVRRLDEPGQHRLVAAMHAIEVPEGQRDRAVGDRGQAAEESQGWVAPLATSGRAARIERKPRIVQGKAVPPRIQRASSRQPPATRGW